MRLLGVSSTSDRVAQTAAAMLLLEQVLEPVFHRDSYGYRPGRSAHDALAVCRRRCWTKDWCWTLISGPFPASVPHSLLLKAVAHHTSERWVLLYISRWLKAPMQMADGTIVPRSRQNARRLVVVFGHVLFVDWVRPALAGEITEDKEPRHAASDRPCRNPLE